MMRLYYLNKLSPAELAIMLAADPAFTLPHGCYQAHARMAEAMALLAGEGRVRAADGIDEERVVLSGSRRVAGEDWCDWQQRLRRRDMAMRRGVAA